MKQRAGRLEGKIAIITGATGGIGEASAKLFLEEGASVMLVGRSNEKLQETHRRLSAFGRVATSVADTSDESAIAAAVDTTLSEFGRIDVLFANAGTEGVICPIEAQTLVDFERVLRTNVIGVWLPMKYCIGPMKKRGRGPIIATASIAGVVGFAGSAPYAASKHAVCGLVRTAALELGPFGIRVNAVAPGPVDNRMMRSVEAQNSPADPEAVHQGIKAMVAMKRYATNEEVAQITAFLASDEASYCNGSVQLVDGGWTAA